MEIDGKQKRKISSLEYEMKKEKRKKTRTMLLMLLLSFGVGDKECEELMRKDTRQSAEVVKGFENFEHLQCVKRCQKLLKNCSQVKFYILIEIFLV